MSKMKIVLLGKLERTKFDKICKKFLIKINKLIKE